MKEGWIGVDLDGTLAYYDEWRGTDHIGRPIAPMVNRVRQWIKEGKKVKIFTARVATDDMREYIKVCSAINTWCLFNLGTILEITNAKDYGMVELWDDRSIQIEKNTGRIMAPDLSKKDFTP